MRARHIATVVVIAMVAGVVSYQAATHDPPDPPVQLIGVVEPPVVISECHWGHVRVSYRSSSGRIISRLDTTERC